MARVVSVDDDLLAPGTVGLTPIGGNTGKVIRFGQWIVSHPFARWFSKDTQPDYQHAFVYLGDGKLIEAEPGGARINDISEYANAEVYWCVNLAHQYTLEQLENVAEEAEKFAGTPYSFLDYFAIAARRLHIPVPGLRAYLNSTGHVICSQLATMAYLRAGLAIYPKSLWPGYVDPMDLYYLDQKFASPAAS